MAFDFNAACTALAARFAPGTIATPSGERAMQASYGQAPNNLKQTPAVVVQPTKGQLIYGGGVKNGQYDVDVEFYLASRSVEFGRIETSRQKWLVNLLGACDGQLLLGLGASGIQKVVPLDWEYRVLTYGGTEYDGIVIHERIWTIEPVTLVIA